MGIGGFCCAALGEDGDCWQPPATPSNRGLLRPVPGTGVHQQAAEHPYREEGLEAVLLSVAGENQVFYLGSSSLCSLVMQAGLASANSGAGELLVGASTCSPPS